TMYFLHQNEIMVYIGHRSPQTRPLGYLFWGEGEVGLTVYSILVRYWEWSSQETRPTLYLMSLETHSPPTH
ncbi:MAG TPA: hypothetical protein VNO32_56440, partial [Candidatus Acidoferrum sp.]|nr:hypothetical protein [Candidatus Acidoferrum sp.]